MQQSTKLFRSNGKLLLTAEYLVLKGAKALALPVNLGQTLEIGFTNSKTIDWITFEKETPLFTASFKPNSLDIIESTDTGKANYIKDLLKAAQELNPEFLYLENGLAIKATVEFDMQWGLGSSSTLINNVAQWAQINAFKLNNMISKGSGYDIACAQNDTPILYQRSDDLPTVEKCTFNPLFLKKLNLVYLNQKMATEKNIAKFLQKEQNFDLINNKANKLTDAFIHCTRLDNFMGLINQHEKVIAEQINEIPVKEKLFGDFNGSIKSLGAWGGDFALVASTETFVDQEQYFHKKGYKTFFTLDNLLSL